MSVAARSLGAPLSRVEGGEKVRGEAVYAYEHQVEGVVYAVLVTAAIAKGTIRTVDAAAALASPGVLAVLTHENAPQLAERDGELGVLQSPRIAYRGQIVGIVVAETLETAWPDLELLALFARSAQQEMHR